MTTERTHDQREALDETAVRVVRSLMAYHHLTQPDIAKVTGLKQPTIERRLSWRSDIRKSWQGWEIYLLADYFGVDADCFYTGRVDPSKSKLKKDAGTTGQYPVDSLALSMAA